MPDHLTSQLLSASNFPEFELGKDIEYILKVTVYSSNATPASKEFRLTWDGSVKGFKPEIIQEY